MIYTRHTSSCRCVGFPRSPQSLTYVSSWGFTASPPSCNSNYLEYTTPDKRLKWKKIPIPSIHPFGALWLLLEP
ncbi:hypothetical protein C3432_21865 [Citrobacter amalonaticus]|uniref:Uncharacterized protein n=1 Tax=Citrobacter amalonaticus TaxID=35703 RepID=A0A2S4RVD4_CITAM|nr:hypothetical protein C3432_21865 [Citrobacter amalonaticus]POT73897.1 hypothetical protein C3436_19330 [Citrobacter amalonaticus]POU64121.1 hypothetical protein C3430_18265 [Citrobacter amalonaticus]POV03753.1 hypothetical protein C3424_21180 [Citrobacter amalonaticus]